MYVCVWGRRWGNAWTLLSAELQLEVGGGGAGFVSWPLKALTSSSALAVLWHLDRAAFSEEHVTSFLCPCPLRRDRSHGELGGSWKTRRPHKPYHNPTLTSKRWSSLHLLFPALGCASDMRAVENYAHPWSVPLHCCKPPWLMLSAKRLKR